MRFLSSRDVRGCSNPRANFRIVITSLRSNPYCGWFRKPKQPAVIFMKLNEQIVYSPCQLMAGIVIISMLISYISKPLKKPL